MEEECLDEPIAAFKEDGQSTQKPKKDELQDEEATQQSLKRKKKKKRKLADGEESTGTLLKSVPTGIAVMY